MYLGHLLEDIDIVGFFNPIDLQGGSGGHITSDWIRMKAHKALIVIYKTAGTAGDDPTFTLEQATSAAGASNKALNFTTIYRKEEVAANLLTTTTWTKTTQSATNTYTHATSAESSLIWAIPIDARDMDVDGGFNFFKIYTADVGSNAQLGCAFCIFGNLHFSGAVANHDSALS